MIEMENGGWRIEDEGWRMERGRLADGTLVQDELVFVGKAFWQGEHRDVEIMLTRSEEALLGTGLLEGMQVMLDFARGTVSVDKAA